MLLQHPIQKRQLQQRIIEIIAKFKIKILKKIFLYKNIFTLSLFGCLIFATGAGSAVCAAPNSQKSQQILVSPSPHKTAKTSVPNDNDGDKKKTTETRQTITAIQKKSPVGKKKLAATRKKTTVSKTVTTKVTHKALAKTAGHHNPSHSRPVNHTQKQVKNYAQHSNHGKQKQPYSKVTPRSPTATEQFQSVAFFSNNTTSGKASTSQQNQQVREVKKTAMNKLMNQLGKPYRWGGHSPSTGFDCSGLVYFAYKDLVNFPMPRTANEMYHLHDTAPVAMDQLKKGDLVFFQTENRALADHVGVYIGNGKFIQSPRAGKNVQITSLNENYWQRHYVGARRIVTPKTTIISKNVATKTAFSKTHSPKTTASEIIISKTASR